ncbi:steroidogenic acute regulatory protein-like [Sitophilus oryzae]|uniref:Steroidogenic acute regulatory protein-like n=1 Tax=Sitophilus oryzae TaxID=7048 RepID=A0A6J2XRJ0_SITOR|nr:steroidogenic acute regulatory protein-like [Sitophilus oryzae]
MTPEEASYAREDLYGSSYQNPSNQPLDISHSHSINTIPSIRDFIISEDMLAGQRLNGRMSNVRRFFCLFVTFDFLFVSLMWLICVMLNGEYIMKALSEQILHYDIHTSLFDIVLLAFLRFLILIFFYAILYINHWIIIALTTALSCAFLIAKVFMFDWPKSSQPVLEVLLVLVSFVISWGQAWFLDFRVIPQENHASRYLITSTESERAPLIRRYVQGLPSVCTESVGNFYSPMGTPEGSMCRFDPQPSTFRPAPLTKEQEQNYKHLGAHALQNTWDLYLKTDWKLEKHQDHAYVYIRKDPKLGTIFKLVAEINSSAKFLLEELYFKVHELATWNSAVKESHKIQTIDEYTDISYQISADGAGGLVSSRDFVSLRHWASIEDCYVIACVKTDHPHFPTDSRYVRGENGAGGYLLQHIENEPKKCRFTWILNTNLNIKIPKTLLEKEMVKMMFSYLRDLRTHISKNG